MRIQTKMSRIQENGVGARLRHFAAIGKFQYISTPTFPVLYFLPSGDLPLFYRCIYSYILGVSFPLSQDLFTLTLAFFYSYYILLGVNLSFAFFLFMLTASLSIPFPPSFSFMPLNLFSPHVHIFFLSSHPICLPSLF